MEGKMAKANLLQALLNPVAKDDVEKLYGPGEGLKIGEKPLFLQAAEARAKKLGISGQQLLESYSRRLKESKYPTPECLPVDRLQAYSSGSALSASETNHIAGCEDCRRVLEEVRPSEETLQPLIEEVRLLAVQATAKAQSAAVGSERENFSSRLSGRSRMFR
jgi:hypothetical protein